MTGFEGPAVFVNRIGGANITLTRNPVQLDVEEGRPRGVTLAMLQRSQLAAYDMLRDLASGAGTIFVR
jgi:hypothetical protein